MNRSRIELKRVELSQLLLEPESARQQVSGSSTIALISLERLVRSAQIDSYSEELAVYFEGRELKPHAEPVSSTELQEGAVYFAVNYVDDEMLIPVMETLVFVGRNLEPEDIGKVYFQDVESYREGVRYDSASEDEWAKFETGSENELGHIFEYERALDVMMRCSIRRKEAGIMR